MKTRSKLQRFGNISLAVRQNGSGIPLIWGHGLLGNMTVEDKADVLDWKEIGKHAEIVRYDARGHGDSDGSCEPEDYRWPCMAADMQAIASSVTAGRGRKRYALGGLSMGAATALEAAVQHPEQVAGLVLVLPPTAWNTRQRQAAIYRRMAWFSGLLGAAPFRLLDWLPIPQREDGRSQLALYTMKGLASANPRHIQAALRGAALSDMPDKASLAKLNVPTLILAWQDDMAHPVSTATALAEILPQVRSFIISDPADLADWTPALCQFLDEIGSPRKRRPAAKKKK